MAARDRHRATIHGSGPGPALVLVHGLGSDQQMWGRLLPHLSGYRVVTYDQAGAGASDPAAYDPERHRSLTGYAADLIDVCADLGLEHVVVVGHSVSAMTAVLTHLRRPDLVVGLVLIAPSPRYQDAPGYTGGLDRTEIDQLLALLAYDYRSWTRAMAPVFMGQPDRPELAEELAASFSVADPQATAELARIAFLSDFRERLGSIQCPTLVLQTQSDPVVPDEVGEYVHEHIPGSSYAKLRTTGHFPQVGAAEETAEAILRFLRPISSFVRRIRTDRPGSRSVPEPRPPES